MDRAFSLQITTTGMASCKLLRYFGAGYDWLVTINRDQN